MSEPNSAVSTSPIDHAATHARIREEVLAELHDAGAEETEAKTSLGLGMSLIDSAASASRFAASFSLGDLQASRLQRYALFAGLSYHQRLEKALGPCVCDGCKSIASRATEQQVKRALAAIPQPIVRPVYVNRTVAAVGLIVCGLALGGAPAAAFGSSMLLALTLTALDLFDAWVDWRRSKSTNQKSAAAAL